MARPLKYANAEEFKGQRLKVEDEKLFCKACGVEVNAVKVCLCVEASSGIDCGRSVAT